MNHNAFAGFAQVDPAQVAIVGDAWAASIHDLRVWPEAPPASVFLPGTAAPIDRRGRGTVHYLDSPVGQAVCRHYRRGGLLAPLLGDRYLWLGAAATRPFREFRLLAELHAAGLPVPRPLAARFERDLLCYRADLITLRIPSVVTLAELLRRAPASIDWPGLGETIASFHRLGVWHADLNAHNVLYSAAQAGKDRVLAWSLIDFDRGRRRPVDRVWPAGNLRRLWRSLNKLGAMDLVPEFAETAWPCLLAAHARALCA